MTRATVDPLRIPTFRPKAVGYCDIYIARRVDTGGIKVGRCKKDGVTKRLRGIRTHNDETVELLLVWRATPRDELLIHGFMAPHRKRGEWYHPTPHVLDWIERQRVAIAQMEEAANG